MFHTTAFILLFFLSTNLSASTDYWQGIAEEIQQHIDQANAQYAAGQPKAAKRTVMQAYFSVFEDRKMEAALRMERGAAYAYQMEERFGSLRKAIQQGAEVQAVQRLAAELKTAVHRDGKLLDQAGIRPNVFEVE